LFKITQTAEFEVRWHFSIMENLNFPLTVEEVLDRWQAAEKAKKEEKPHQ
jgi:hypothetical protein